MKLAGSTKFKEKLIERLLLLCSLLSVFTTFGIIWVLLSESIGFFQKVSLFDFLTDTQWTPLFTDKHFGILPLLSGTILTTVIAILVAVPFGLASAVYLSGAAHHPPRAAAPRTPYPWPAAAANAR